MQALSRLIEMIIYAMMFSITLSFAHFIAGETGERGALCFILGAIYFWSRNEKK